MLRLEKLDSCKLKLVSNYPRLRERGLLLADEVVEEILNDVNTGINLAVETVGCSPDPRFHLISSNVNHSTLRYVLELVAIDVPLLFLKSLEEPCMEKKSYLSAGVHIELPCNLGALEVPVWLYILAGAVEETVHHFQHFGLGRVKERITIESGKVCMASDQLSQIVFAAEVEARALTDEALRKAGYPAVWEELDRRLRLVGYVR